MWLLGTSLRWRSAPWVLSWMFWKLTTSASLVKLMAHGRLNWSSKAGSKGRTSSFVGLEQWSSKQPNKKTKQNKTEHNIKTKQSKQIPNTYFASVLLEATPVAGSRSEATKSMNKPAVLCISQQLICRLNFVFIRPFYISTKKQWTCCKQIVRFSRVNPFLIWKHCEPGLKSSLRFKSKGSRKSLEPLNKNEMAVVTQSSMLGSPSSGTTIWIMSTGTFWTMVLPSAMLGKASQFKVWLPLNNKKLPPKESKL